MQLAPRPDLPSPALVAVEDFYVTLWLGALMLAGNRVLDPLPDDLGEQAEQFFAAFPAVAKA
jgi:hypothetical protein